MLDESWYLHAKSWYGQRWFGAGEEQQVCRCESHGWQWSQQRVFGLLAVPTGAVGRRPRARGVRVVSTSPVGMRAEVKEKHPRGA